MRNESIESSAILSIFSSDNIKHLLVIGLGKGFVDVQDHLGHVQGRNTARSSPRARMFTGINFQAKEYKQNMFNGFLYGAGNSRPPKRDLQGKAVFPWSIGFKFTTRNRLLEY